MKFFPLHVHSHYSLLDGLSKPKDIASRCVELDLEGSAITDHGTVSGAVSFVKAMKNQGKKPILGCEFYICQEDPKEKQQRKLSHLVVLAKNFQGWKQLLAATSESNRPEFFYYRPRLDLENLARFADGNLIAFSGHMGSDLANVIFSEPSEAYNAATYEEARKLVDPNWLVNAKTLATQYQRIFGKGNFFIEIQLIDHLNLPASKVVAEALRHVSKDLQIAPVATPDAHYARSEDAYDQRVLLCNKMDITLKDVQQRLEKNIDIGLSTFFKSDKYHIPSLEEMQEIHTDEEIENTYKIACQCEEYDITHKPILPKFPTPDNISSEQQLYKICKEGWLNRKEKIQKIIEDSKHTREEYGGRVKKELEILQEAGLADYFLIVHDIVQAAKARGEIVGAGRGSAAGSLVLYLMGVTDIDPIEHGLIFERFYNAGRNTKNYVSLPDVDMDFEIQSREKTINYIRETYGADRVAQILTFSRMQGRGALKDVLRVHSACSFEEMNRITQWIPDEADISDQLQEMRDSDKESGGDGEASIIMWALEHNSKDLEQWCYIDDHGKLQGSMARRFEQAIRLEGTKRSQSKHAAGIVISQEPLNHVCPMVHDKKSEEMIAGMEMDDLESMGHVKFDILGIALLDKVHGVKNLLESGGV